MNNEHKSILNLSVLGICLFNLFPSVAVVTRITYYFRIFDSVLLANLVFYFKLGTSRVIICVIIFIYFFLMFYAPLDKDYYNYPEYPKLTPYKTLFER